MTDITKTQSASPLEHKDFRVRKKAAEECAKPNCTPEQLVPLLRDFPSVSKTANKSFVRLEGDPELLLDIINNKGTKRPRNRFFALGSYGQLKGPADKLLGLIYDSTDRSDVRVKAIYAYEKVGGDPNMLKDLIEKEGEDVDVRVAAIITYAHLNGEAGFLGSIYKANDHPRILDAMTTAATIYRSHRESGQ